MAIPIKPTENIVEEEDVKRFMAYKKAVDDNPGTVKLDIPDLKGILGIELNEDDE